MSIKNLSQPSFADAIICRHGKSTQWLEEMTQLISWSSLAALFKGFYTSTEGLRPVRRWSLGKQLFEEVNRQIAARGMVLKRGTLIDASIIPAAVNGPG